MRNVRARCPTGMATRERGAHCRHQYVISASLSFTFADFHPATELAMVAERAARSSAAAGIHGDA